MRDLCGLGPRPSVCLVWMVPRQATCLRVPRGRHHVNMFGCFLSSLCCSGNPIQGKDDTSHSHRPRSSASPRAAQWRSLLFPLLRGTGKNFSRLSVCHRQPFLSKQQRGFHRLLGSAGTSRLPSATKFGLFIFLEWDTVATVAQIPG